MATVYKQGLMQAVLDEDKATIAKYKHMYMHDYGYNLRMWYAVLQSVNTAIALRSYKLVEFDAKVNSNSADKSYIQAIKPEHNED